MKKNEIETLKSRCGIDTFSISSKSEPVFKGGNIDYVPEVTCKRCERNQYNFYIHIDDISNDANDNSITAAAAIENCIIEMNCVKTIVTRVDFRTDFYDND